MQLLLANASGALRRWLRGEPLSRRAHLVFGLLLPMWVLAANMWTVHRFTVDDAYISFRYARNLADGLGLVYNAGELIEGYTNFLWTVLIAGGLGLGVDAHTTAKLLGAAAAFGTLAVVYRLTQRMQPLGVFPPICTWLLASSSTFSGYAVFGLESTGFAFLVALATLMMFREEEIGSTVPWSGFVFALAGLTRPEAPLFAGIPMLLLGRGFFGRRNLLRGALFTAPLVAHLLWRHAYYGEWTPATLHAKTGDLRQQWRGGKGYVLGWVDHAGPIVFLSMYGLALGIARRSREIMSVALVFLVFVAYVILVGGDWMSYFRFMVPAEPFGFVLVCVGARAIVERRDRAANVAMLLFAIYVAVLRQYHLREAHQKFLKEEKRFWDSVAGQTAEWLATRAKPGRVAIGDIGYVGWRTNYPILDLLGLVDPVIKELPGGYTKKLGEGYKERFFDVMPEYAVIIMAGQSCTDAAMEGSRILVEDKRFKNNYAVAQNFQVVSDASWCIFKRKGF